MLIGDRGSFTGGGGGAGGPSDSGSCRREEPGSNKVASESSAAGSGLDAAWPSWPLLRSCGGVDS